MLPVIVSIVVGGIALSPAALFRSPEGRAVINQGLLEGQRLSNERVLDMHARLRETLERTRVLHAKHKEMMQKFAEWRAAREAAAKPRKDD